LGFFERFFAPRRGSRAALTLAHARAAELRGQLSHAASLFEQAGRPDEAARVILLQGDAAIDTTERLGHYLQAARTAPEGSPLAGQARRKRANLLLAVAGETSSPTVALRQALLDVARELELGGEYEAAAEAYARGGSEEGQARSLARAGDVDRLDALLLEQQDRDRQALARRRALGELRTLLATGRRREALALARQWRDDAFEEQARNIEARRLRGPIVRVRLRGRPMTLVLAEEVVIGRSATIAVPAGVVSREHAAVLRRGSDVVVRDLGGTNGTTLRGLPLAPGSEARVGDGVEVRLGNQVPVVVRPAGELPGAVGIEVGGVRYVAPLGPAPLGIGRWSLELGGEGWAELATGGHPRAYAGELECAERVTLLAGDGFADAREGARVLEVDRDG
jgi:hypothetical protein